MDFVSAVDFIAIICSSLSFIFSSSLWFLLWRVRKTSKTSKQKRSAILLTNHVYYMALCDVLISIWCILTYLPVMLSPNISVFNRHPSDNDMNGLSFANISQHFPCFMLAILGQFAVISSAIWYILISYCLWRVLFGYNPFSISIRNKSFILSASFVCTPKLERNLKFRKKPDENYDITPLKEDESVEILAAATALADNKSNEKLLIDDTSPRTKFLNTPTIDSSLGISLVSTPTEKDARGVSESYQLRERQEIAGVLKRHQIIVWSISILFTLVPFCTNSMGINIQYIGDMDRDLECWIGSKFWVFSFYSVITIAVLNAMCMLLYIIYKILKNREYKSSAKTARYHNRSRIRRSTSGSTRNYKVLKRFGVFVGCYLFCWILPISRRYYVAFIDPHHTPHWLILCSEVSICIFPAANAIVWYTNPSFRRLISHKLVLIIKCDCCHPFGRKYSGDSSKYTQNKAAYNIRVGTKAYTKTHDLEHKYVQIVKENKSTGGFNNTLTTNTATTYGSFCDMMDIATYSSHYSYPLDRDSKVIVDDGISSDAEARSVDDIDSTTIEEGMSFGETIDTMDMEQIMFEKQQVQSVTNGKHRTDVSMSSVRLPSQLSDVVVATYSSSLSDELRKQHGRYSSDFTDIVAMTSHRNSIIGSDAGEKMFVHVVTPRDDANRPCVVTPFTPTNLTPNDTQYTKAQNKENEETNNRNAPLVSPHGAINSPKFGNSLFTDDEEYDDKLKKLQNSINEFCDDTEDNSDDNKADKK